ncbi:MAG: hypothetical protein IJT83_01760 [Victivallales bacterium]|nr:hypothetical protein [Victivallales bacterium]
MQKTMMKWMNACFLFCIGALLATGTAFAQQGALRWMENGGGESGGKLSADELAQLLAMVGEQTCALFNISGEGVLRDMEAIVDSCQKSNASPKIQGIFEELQNALKEMDLRQLCGSVDLSWNYKERSIDPQFNLCLVFGKHTRVEDFLAKLGELIEEKLEVEKEGAENCRIKGTDLSASMDMSGRKIFIGNKLKDFQDSYRGVGVSSEVSAFLPQSADLSLAVWFNEQNEGLLKKLGEEDERGVLELLPRQLFLNVRLADKLEAKMSCESESGAERLAGMLRETGGRIITGIASEFSGLPVQFLPDRETFQVTVSGKEVTLSLACNCTTLLVSSSFALLTARRKALRISCTNNLKHLAVACMLYAVDHDENLPPAKSWEKALHEYLGETKVAICPAVIRRRGDGGKHYSYYGGGSLNNLDDAARRILFVCWEKHDKPDEVHVTFADGHVASVSRDSVETAIYEHKPGELPRLP